MRIFISAGEPSGDLHGANFIRALRRLQPEVELAGFGGDKMAAAGCRLLYPLCRLAVMGLVRVFANLPSFLGVLSQADRWFRHHRPDAVVLIDYPGLHWWLARRAHYHGIPVFYFVPPQIWAWARWRVSKMRRWVDHVLCTLPFEQTWYQAHGVKATYVGHPYFDELQLQRLDPGFVNEQQRQGGPIIALLPGSRAQEVLSNLPTMLRTAIRVHRRLPQARFLVACYKQEHHELVTAAFRRRDLPVEAHVGRTPEIIHLAEVCVAVSGSVSLELLYRLKPTVVIYKVSSFNLRLGQRLLASKYISLVNLLAERALFPEHLTDRCESRAIADRLLHWLTDAAASRELCEELRHLREKVGQPGACERAAGYLRNALSSPLGTSAAA
jgi:lipid-A-disaccharide synthase